MKKIFIFLISLIFSYISYTQDTIIYNETINLNSDLSDYINVKVGATDEITLLPGFEYNADNSGTFSAEIYSFVLEEPYVINETGGPEGTVGTLVGTDGVVGAIHGVADVSQSGAATYTIPISVPVGNLGMEPSLSITYNSQSGESILGYGVGLSGISSITATGKNNFYDGETSAISSVDGDVRLMWDGQRLVGINAVGLLATSYNTLIESHAVITRDTTGSNISFLVKTADGKTIEYGNTTDSRLSLDATTEWIWMVNKITDRDGNFILYEYNKDDDKKQIVISKIKYGGAITDPENEIEFTYSEKQEIKYSYIHDDLIISDLQLDNISITSANQNYGSYEFSYTNQAGNTYLSQVMQYDKDDNHYNATAFTWEIPTSNLSAQPTTKYIQSGPNFKYFSGDFTGDGFSDLVSVEINHSLHNYQYYLYKGSSTGLGSNYDESGELPRSYLYEHWNALRLGYINKYNPVETIPTDPEFEDVDAVTAGDFDGDGILELLVTVSEWDEIGALLPENLNENFDFNSDIYDEIVDIFLNYNEELPYPLSLEFSYKVAHFYHFDQESTSEQRKKKLTLNGVRLSKEFVAPGPDLVDYGYMPFTDGNKIIYTNTSMSSLTEMQSLEGSLVWGEFNGDGKMDYLKIESSSFGVYLYNSQTDNFSFSETVNEKFLGLIDINGDGIMGWVTQKEEFVTYSYLELWDEYDGDLSSIYDWNNFLNEYGLGDNFLDYMENICNQNNDIICRTNFLNSGGTDFSLGHNLAIKHLTNYGANDVSLGYFDINFAMDILYTRSADINADGKNELLLFTNENLEKIYFDFIPNYSNEAISFTYSTLNSNESYGRELQFGDYNGDGIIEILGPETNKHNSFITNNLSQPAIEKITNGLGLETEFSYSKLTDPTVYTKGITGTFPVVRVVGPWQVVKSISTDNGVADPIETTYKYEDARIHIKGKGFLGFMKLSSTNTNLDITQKTEMSYNTSYYHPYLYKAQKYVGVELQEESENTVGFMNLDENGRFRMQTQSSSIENFESGTTTTQVFTYNEDGLVESKTSHINNELSVVQNYSYTGNGWTGDYSIEEIETTHTRGLEFETNTQFFEYESLKGRLIEKTEFKNTDRERITSYTIFDDFGNIKKTEIEAKKGESLSLVTLVSQADFTSDGRFIVEQTDPDNNTTIFDLDPAAGVLLSSTSPNSMQVEYEYGAFNRKTKTIYPDQKEELIALRWVNGQTDAPADALFYSYKKETSSAAKLSFFDATGRELRTVVRGFKDEAIYIDQEYNDNGSLYRKSMPYYSSDTPLWTSYTYDTKGRVTFEEAPDGTETEYNYSVTLQTTVTVTKGSKTQTMRTLTNAMGETIESEDNDGNIVYSVYYADGKLKNTYTSINPTDKIEFSYDGQGNRSSISDPDAGTITTIYDGYGQLVSQTDAKSNTTTFDYDNLGRITESFDGTITTSYSYYSDDSKPYFGQLSSISNSDNSLVEEYVYDEEFGRLQILSKEIDSKTFEFSYTYDWFGRPYSKTYPSGFSVSYDYNDYGDLKSIKAGGLKVWECSDVNALGQITSYSQGSYNTSVDYDNYGVLERLTTGNVFNMDYVFDDNGNLAFREDILTHQNESFQYDTLNRLEQISYEFDGYPISAGNLSLTYEDGGNISSKSDVAGNIEYGDGTAGPHALTSLNDPNPSYQPSDQIISYTNFNKVASISQLDENGDPINLTYTYGLDNQRIKTVFTRDAVTEKTKYFLDDYEEVTTSSGTKKYHYIFGGTGLCAIFVRDDQDNDTLFYTLNDHLGSLNGVINAETNAVSYYSYDAWGNPRDNDDWTTKTDADLFADRGFTGHEHLIEFGLIDMNGRIYDPMLGRFLSPDPYVQMPGYADNFNRYSYALNNPLVYVDPDGECFGLFLLGAAIIGGLYNGIQNNGSWDWVDAIQGAGASMYIAGTMYLSVAMPAFMPTGPGALPGFMTAGGMYATTTVNSGAMNWMAYGSFEPNYKAAGISAIPGLIQGIVGGVDAVIHKGSFLTGEGYTLKFTKDDVINISEFKGSQKAISPQSIEESINKNNYYYNPNKVDFVASDTQPEGLLGLWELKHHKNNIITIYRDAFLKEELLDLVVGHEIMHQKFYEWGTQLGYFNFQRNYWFSTPKQHDVIYNWMHETYIGSWVGRSTSPWQQRIIDISNIWGSPINNPYF